MITCSARNENDSPATTNLIDVVHETSQDHSFLFPQHTPSHGIHNRFWLLEYFLTNKTLKISLKLFHTSLLTTLCLSTSSFTSYCYFKYLVHERRMISLHDLLHFQLQRHNDARRCFVLLSSLHAVNRKTCKKRTVACLIKGDLLRTSV